MWTIIKRKNNSTGYVLLLNILNIYKLIFINYMTPLQARLRECLGLCVAGIVGSLTSFLSFDDFNCDNF